MKAIGAFIIMLFLFGCTGGRPATNRKVAVKPIAVPLPGGGSKIITSSAIEPIFRPSAARLALVPWRYDLPQGTVASNYFWNMERSTDLKNWSMMVSNMVGDGPIIDTTSHRMEFFRLKGRP